MIPVNRRKFIGIAAALGSAAVLPGRVFAQASEVKIGIGFGVGFLPTFILRELKLVEKHAKAAGLDVTANYQRFSGSGAMQDAVLSSSVDIGPDQRYDRLGQG
jgi:NitT/TauT family transport system substrate-binding protein